MVIKSLTITEEAYNSLSRLKMSDESFSKVIIRITSKQKPPIEKFFGALKDSETSADEWIQRIKNERMTFDQDAKERLYRIRNRE